MTNDTDDRDTTAIIDTTRTPALAEVLTTIETTTTMTNDSDTDTDSKTNDSTDGKPAHVHAVELTDSATEAVAIGGLTVLGYAAFKQGNVAMAQMAMAGIAGLSGVKMYRRKS